MGILI